MNISKYRSSAMTYAQYVTLIDELHDIQRVTGPLQTPDLLQYSLHNRKRMERWEKTYTVPGELAEKLASCVKTPLVWLTITEGWCGDASQIIPVLEKLAQAHTLVQHRLILRDDHLELMDQFLTNGSRAIPITIIADAESGNVLGHWGPRPSDAQAIMDAYKAEVKTLDSEEAKHTLFEDAKLKLHSWYARDKGKHTIEEFLSKLESVVCTNV